MASTKNKYVYGALAEEVDYEQSYSPRESSKLNTAPQVDYDPYEQNKVLKSKKVARSNAKMKAKILLTIFIVFGMFATIMYRYAQISQLNYESNQLSKEHVKLQNENVRVGLEIQKAMDLNSIRDIAEKKLNMHKPDKSQIVYINVPKKDITIPAEKQDSGVVGAVKDVESGLKKFLNVLY